MENEFGYFSKDVADELSVTTSTLRRWSIELEKHGYSINRNDKDQRIYFERDFKAFRELKKLLSNAVPFTDAIKAIVSTNFDNKNAIQTPSVQTDTMRLSKRELEETIEKAIEKEHDRMIKIFEEKLNNTIEMRDRMLMQQLNKSLEDNKKLVAAAQEERKSWWRKLF